MDKYQTQENMELSVLHDMIHAGGKYQEKCISYAAENLTTANFYNFDNQKIFKKIIEMFANGKDISIVTISDELPELYEKICFDSIEISTSSNFSYLCKILIDKKIKRDSEFLVKSFLKEENEMSHEELAFRLLALEQPQNKYPEYTTDELMPFVVKQIEEIQTGKAVLYKTGIQVVDKNIRIKAGNMISVVAPPKTGKTWLLCWLSTFFSSLIKTAIESAEMYPEDLYMRLASLVVGKDMTQLMYDNEAPRRLFNEFVEASKKLSENKNLLISNVAGMEYAQLKTRIMRHIKAGYKVIALDYLQRVPSGAEWSDLRIPIAGMSRDLANLAKKEKILLIVFSQANDEAIKSGKTMPWHSKESRAIREDSDVIMCLTEKKPEEIDDVESEWKNILMYVEQRNGFCGDIDLVMNPRTGQFTEKSNREEPRIVKWGNQ